MMTRVLALLALAACCAAASSLEPAKDLELAEPVKDLELAVHDKAREERSVADFMKTLGRPLAGSQDQSFNIGGVYPYDRQLISNTVYKSSSWMSVNTKEMTYSSTATLHCIQIVDLLKTGKNALVTVQKGGIGQRQVTLKFKSQRGEKINYLVLLWGQ